MMNKIKICLILVIMAALTVSGCAGSEDISEIPGYDVYFLDSENEKLVAEKYEAENDSVLKTVYLLLNRMCTPGVKGNLSVFGLLIPEEPQITANNEMTEMPSGDISEELMPLLTDKGLINDISYSNRIVTINFGDQYNLMDNVNEVLFRAAVVKTVSQIDQVDYVSFNVNMQPITTGSGSLLGLMNASNFINDTGDNMDNLEWADVKLYFADESGQKLIPESLEMAYDRSKTIEQAVVERLIKGPVEKSSKKTVPTGTKLLGISVKDGIAYVNFDSSFVDNTADVSPDVTIYSIVNSLCELNSVKKVQILVNGAQDGTFRDSFPLSSTYERNLDILYENTEE